MGTEMPRRCVDCAGERDDREEARCQWCREALHLGVLMDSREEQRRERVRGQR